MKRKNSNRKYMTNREQYKNVKRYDHAQFDEFCTIIYTEGYKDGRNSVSGVDVKEIMKVIKTVKGIGEKRLAQIEDAVTVLFGSREEMGYDKE